MFNNKNKTYTLKYIEKVFTRIPTIFILILAVLLIVITHFILDFKQKRDVDLIHQKQIINYEFSKKDKLYKFVDTVNAKVNEELDEVKRNITLIVYKTIGHLEESSKNKFDINNIKLYLDDIQKEQNIQIVMFDAKNNNVLYGKDTIQNLQEVMFNHKNSDKFKKLILKYIFSQGKNNLQYWKYDQQKNLILSFFDIANIEQNSYYIGAFSSINNIKSITKEMIHLIIKENKERSDDFIWFYDSNDDVTFNYFNNQKKVLLENIIEKNNKSRKSQILDYYTFNDNENPIFNKDVYLYKKFGYLVSIDYDSTHSIKVNKNEIENIKYDYKKLFYIIVLFIILSISVLILFSIIFSRFIKKIFGKYNEELSLKTQSLEHWKKRFELAIIASNDGLWDIDFKDDKIYFSDKWLSMSGYDKNELTNLKDWFNLIHKDDIKDVENKFDDIFNGYTDSLQCEYRLRTKNEGYKWVFARGKIFKKENSDSKRMLMMSMDIDKNKKMIKELLDIELLVEDGRMVIFKLNNDKKLSVKYISNSIKTYGYNKVDFENNSMNFINIVHEDDKDTLNLAIKESIQKESKNFTKIFRIRNAKNNIKWVFLRAILLKDHFSNVTQFYGYFHDITKIKVSQEELKLKVQQEVEKNIKKDRLLVQQSKLASMGEMLGNIAHQWRQPLNTVNLIIHYLRDNYQNENFTQEQFEKYINKSKTQIDYMSHTIDDFRNFYKPTKKINKFNISSVVNDVLEILKEQLEHDNINVKLDLEDIIVTNYENELKQTLLNIINNAKDAIIKRRKKETFKSLIRITIIKKKNFAKISITNNGGNIKDDIMQRIFEPYFTTKFEKQGTGIGLYMSRIIIETNMKGKIKVQNIKDGVEFKINIPLDT